jgi:hypothetical protein
MALAIDPRGLGINPPHRLGDSGECQSLAAMTQRSAPRKTTIGVSRGTNEFADRISRPEHFHDNRFWARRVDPAGRECGIMLLRKMNTRSTSRSTARIQARCP